MTPDRMKEIISDFTEAQGLDAPLKACACCGLRNLDSSSTTRSYREVDIADYKVQNMLKLRDETDDEGDIDGEDDPEEDGGDDNSDESLSVDDRSSDPMECEDTPQLDDNTKCDPLIQFGSAKTLQKHRRAMKEKPLSIPYNDDGDTKEVEAWRLCSVWPARKPEDLVEEKEKLPDYLFDEESGEQYTTTSTPNSSKRRCQEIHSKVTLQQYVQNVRKSSSLVELQKYHTQGDRLPPELTSEMPIELDSSL